MNTNPSRTRNLVPNADRTPEQRKENTRKAGIASGKARREKRLLSQEYAKLLADGFSVEGVPLTLAAVVSAILARCDSSSVALLREIREATEGSRVALESSNVAAVPFVFVDPPQRASEN